MNGRNMQRTMPGLILLCLLGGAVLAGTPSPARVQLDGFLAAFNSGDRATLTAFGKDHAPPDFLRPAIVDQTLEMSRTSGGYDVLEVNEIDSLSVVDDAVGVPEALAHAEDFRILLRAIESLPERCRQVVTLRKIYGLSQKEVATQLGVSEATVETQGGIGLRKCIEYFRRHGYAPKNPS